MDAELHNRFEEAANLSAIEDTEKGRQRDEYYISALADHENGYREGFVAGAEFGYKEAIAMAKMWVFGYIRSNSNDLSAYDAEPEFEKYMNKLLEE